MEYTNKYIVRKYKKKLKGFLELEISSGRLLYTILDLTGIAGSIPARGSIVAFFAAVPG